MLDEHTGEHWAGLQKAASPALRSRAKAGLQPPNNPRLGWRDPTKLNFLHHHVRLPPLPQPVWKQRLLSSFCVSIELQETSFITLKDQELFPDIRDPAEK